MMVRKQVDASLRRDRILQEAIHAIGERGYYGFSLPELARRCGLSNAGLLHHFPSKNQLLLAVLREIEDRETEILRPLVHAVSASPQEDQSMRAALDVLRTMLVRAIARPALGRLFLELQVESLNKSHPAYKWWQTRDATLLNLFGELVGPHVSDPASTALQLAAMLDGLLLRWLRGGATLDAVGEWERVLAKLLPEFSSALASGRPSGKSGRRSTSKAT